MPAFVRTILLVWLMVLPGPVLAQSQLPAVPNLNQLLRDSAYILSGTVIGVKPLAPANSGGVSTVEITFRVEEAIRGVQPGQTLVIHEWAGMWNSGDRYHPGERLVLFLHRSSRLGLTSPVGGRMGRFEVDSKGQVVLEQARIGSLSPTSSPPPTPPSGLPDSPGKTRLSPRALARALQLAGQLSGKD